MNQVSRRPLSPMTADTFLAWAGDGSGRRFQLVDGEIRPMSPASRIHAAIQANLAWHLVGATRLATPALQVLTEGAIIPAVGAAKNVRVPDLMVVPANDHQGDQVAEEPMLIVEILSPGNSDETRDNVRAYMTLSSLREIALVHSERILAEVFRRDDVGAWADDPQFVRTGERLRLISAGLNCLLDEIYAGTWLARGQA